MPGFSPPSLARWTGGRWTAEPVEPLEGFSIDTRDLRRGQVFVAIKTDRNDGHYYLAEAEEGGAGAALVARADPSLSLPQLVVEDPLTAFQAIAREHRRSFLGKVVGISGSAGKTSTKDLLAILLGGAEEGALATEGNLNNHLGVPLTLTRLDPTRHAFAVIEAGISGPGEMKPLADMIEPDVSLITLVAEAHTEGLGGIAGVAREKAVLPAATRASGIAIFPREAADHSPFRDLGVRRMIVERAEVVRPADPPKDTVYFSVTQRAGETAVALAYGPPPPMAFHFRRVSDGMAQNAVLAICAALWLGIPRDAIQDRLARWQPARLRGEIRNEDGRLLYLDCYNANPASMLDALATFAEIAPAGEARMYVLGCMEELGAGAPKRHHDVGRAVPLREVDRLFVIGRHAHDLCAGVLERGNFSAQIQIVSSLEPVAACFAEWRGSVFVKGSRRHHLERVLEVQTCLPLA